MKTRKPLVAKSTLQRRTPLKRSTTPLKSKSVLKSGTKKLSRRSKTPVSKAKAKAWAAFSQYIRARDAKCVTCGGSNDHAGHFFDGRHSAVLFSEFGVHSQCYSCNVGKHGNKVKYWLFMEKTYGRPHIDQLIAESTQTVKYKLHDYERIEQEYRGKLSELS